VSAEPVVTTLQRVLWPTPELCSYEELYLRCSPGAWYSHAAREVHLLRGGAVRFDTYFNGFSVGKWLRHSTVRRVGLRVEAQGEVEVTAILHHPHRAYRIVAAGRLSSETPAGFTLPFVELSSLIDGQLSLEVRGLGPESVVLGGGVDTSDPVERESRLGVVITTFNRPDYVEGNLDRLAAALAEHKDYRDRIDVLVVDNARNLAYEPPPGAPFTIVPNANLGGAGGFARGLMHFRAATESGDGPVTHVLFMDDDIRFEPEVVLRTCDFLAYAADPDTCLAGAMLTEERPHMQFEAGAEFLTESIHPFRPIGSHVDLRHVAELVDNDIERPAGYGAWWFFAFPLALGSVNPLPVFVRGDDVCFGLQRTGPHTVTMNGIGVWHQDFNYKNGPPAFYYESRNLPLVSSLSSDKYSALHLVRRFVYQTTRTLLAMKYESAEARIAGTRAFLEGPDEWLATDHEQRNTEIRRHDGERLGPLSRQDLAVPAFKPRNQIVTRGGGALSSLLLSGHLLPRRLSRRGRVGVEVSSWSPSAVFGREEVVYRYEPTGEGYVCRRDRKRFFALTREMLRTAAAVPGRFTALKADYRAAYPELTSDSYWQRQFEPRDPDPPGASASPG